MKCIELKKYTITNTEINIIAIALILCSVMYFLLSGENFIYTSYKTILFFSIIASTTIVFKITDTKSGLTILKIGLFVGMLFFLLGSSDSIITYGKETIRINAERKEISDFRNEYDENLTKLHNDIQILVRISIIEEKINELEADHKRKKNKEGLVSEMKYQKEKLKSKLKVLKYKVTQD